MADESKENKDLLAWLTDLSEDVIQRISEAPGADRVFATVKGLGDKVEELQRRTRGFEQFERRLTALEKRVDAMAKPKPARKPASAARAPKPKPTTPKTP